MILYITFICLFLFGCNVNGYKKQIAAVRIWFDVFSVKPFRTICREKKSLKKKGKGLVTLEG
jgi:hypothetical protein